VGANSLITQIARGGVVVSGNTLHLAFRVRKVVLVGVQVNAGGREFPHHSNRERRGGCQWDHPPSHISSEGGVGCVVGGYLCG